MPAVPGIPAPIKALCVVPFGMEEGSDAEILEAGVWPCSRRTCTSSSSLASTTRKGDQVGEIVEDWAGDIHEVSTLETMLPASEGERGGTVVPISAADADRKT